MKALSRILYVEDEPDIREIVVMTLEALGGFTLQPCASGQEALDAAPAFAPDLIILDVMMPGMDGPTTLQKLRTLPGTAQTPVIFMTAKVQSHEVEQYKTMGALGLIVKPFDPMTLVEQIKTFWASSHD